MRLGIISDTHGLLRPEVFEVFEGVDLILHAGDIGPPEILAELETIAPVRAVWGNTDGFDIRRHVPEVIEERIEGFDFLIIHGHQLGQPTPAKLNEAYPAAEVIIFGHTHRPLLETVDVVVTVMNPGGAGSRRFDLPASVGIMELEPGIPPRARLVALTGMDDDSEVRGKR
ncbi:MAG TPA: metallophosphoesterase family protein [Gemmatimonadales bacterium]|nr:metallophosphoesterase family protein [Gemmatimonadales bacterium]